MDLYGVKDYLERAKKLLNDSGQHSFKYACLELRFCLEIIAYRQLEQFGDEIPGSIVGQWKPDQIIRKLASFSPESEFDGVLSIGSSNSVDTLPDEWEEAAESKAIRWRVFRKHYNKLGSYLHAPMKFKDGERHVPSGNLDEIISDIEHVLSATVILAVKSIINAVCECGEAVCIGQFEFEDDELVRCNNKSCGLFWKKVTREDGGQVLQHAKAVVFRCGCEATMSVPVDRVWDRFSCRGCHATYRLNLGLSKVVRL
ncbi:hypothetical protein [Pseudomonas costantinii]|uniref:Uncharacterized protein n=1 Tax=Pseudomonas costantinii TaxID=168469 RepID=A0A1S2UX04_9PSED|nr:hypothetical protein [Pseudomonas costantinii]OIN50961.1 hypothetical protein BFL40_15720 [Pseudomonas costantinii]SED87060.1 hypothetical protein SAMN04515675_2894 [Pseudomonas costantinii]